jgi:hypothetical protein
MAPQNDIPERTPEELENGPKVNGDWVSWLYVVGGIPSMILFFVILFSLVGSCDSRNIMLHG